MEVMSRFGRALAVFFLMAGAGCGSGSNSDSKSSHLACTRSVAEFCSYLHGAGCPLTWDDVQNGQAGCFAPSAYLEPDSRVVADCGGYRKLISVATDVSMTFYYDATSGQLVAIVGTTAVGSIQRECSGGPAEGFTLPTCPPLDGGPVKLDCGPDAPVI
jgi:hypothetical protein